MGSRPPLGVSPSSVLNGAEGGSAAVGVPPRPQRRRPRSGSPLSPASAAPPPPPHKRRAVPSSSGVHPAVDGLGHGVISHGVVNHGVVGHEAVGHEVVAHGAVSHGVLLAPYPSPRAAQGDLALPPPPVSRGSLPPVSSFAPAAGGSRTPLGAPLPLLSPVGAKQAPHMGDVVPPSRLVGTPTGTSHPPLLSPSAIAASPSAAASAASPAPGRYKRRDLTVVIPGATSDAADSAGVPRACAVRTPSGGGGGSDGGVAGVGSGGDGTGSARMPSATGPGGLSWHLPAWSPAPLSRIGANAVGVSGAPLPSSLSGTQHGTAIVIGNGGGALTPLLPSGFSDPMATPRGAVGPGGGFLPHPAALLAGGGGGGLLPSPRPLISGGVGPLSRLTPRRPALTPRSDGPFEST